MGSIVKYATLSNLSVSHRKSHAKLIFFLKSCILEKQEILKFDVCLCIGFAKYLSLIFDQAFSSSSLLFLKEVSNELYK